MKKLLLNLLLVLFVSTSAFAIPPISGQPIYDFALNFVGLDAGGKEIYQVDAYVDLAAPAGYVNTSFTIPLGWDANSFNNFTFVTEGVTTFGLASYYSLIEVSSAVNGTPKDLANVTMDPVGNLIPLTHGASEFFPLFRFSVTRVAGASAIDPLVLYPGDATHDWLTSVLGGGEALSFTNDVDGNGTTPPNNQFAQQTLSTGSDIAFAKAELSTAYPNPTSGLVTLNTNNQVLSYNVSNMLGQDMSISGSTSMDSDTTLDLSNMEAGIYFITLKKGESRQVLRVIKE